ncbi:MAG: hypothetical protein EBV79_11785, partial [Betaproteobacteria bacterium]|nr:hypothetical protein [Betaproteobacteria bacterium]
SYLRGVNNDGSVYVYKSGATPGIARYKVEANGATVLDTTYGTNGQLMLGGTSPAQVIGSPTTTGALYVLETVQDLTSPSGHLELHRYTAAGALDSTFAVVLPGTMATDYTSIQVRRGVYGDDGVYVLQAYTSTTTVNAVSTTNSGVQVLRYTSSGALDSHYGVTIPNAMMSQIRGANGGGVVVETTVTDSQGMQLAALQHYKSDSSLNTNYGTGGTLVIRTRWCLRGWRSSTPRVKSRCTAPRATR